MKASKGNYSECEANLKEKNDSAEWKGDLISKIRVAVNGYGMIRKRVADAVAMQEDMELVGLLTSLMITE